jgi:thiol-disulfide isomerase/thioredoxin
VNIKRTKIILPMILVATICAARADEQFSVLKVGGETYSNVTVTAVTATDIFFTCSDGLANVKIKDLSPDLQQHFGYDPEKAKAAELRQAANQASYQDQVMHQPVERPTDMTREARMNAKSFLNQQAPDLIVEKWLTPEPNRRGKFTLIDFWATWCPPCRRAIPELNGYYEKFGDKLVVIGISDETEEAVRKLVSPKIEYAVAIDTQARTKKTVEVTGIPHVLIIDPQGIVRWEGYPFLEGYELNEKIVADILARYSN